MPLGLGYQPFATQDYGFGQGWGLPWSTYDPGTGQKGTLFTSEGANFKVTKDDNPSITQQKPLVLNFQRSGSGYVVTHAHGGVEVLGETINSISIPSQIFTSLGNSVTLNWSQEPFGVTLIQDDEGNTLLSASYQTGSSATLTLNPGSPDEEFDITAAIDGGLLQSITVGDWTWTFFYTDTGQFGPEIPQLLKKIVHPTGLVEEVVYTGDIMAFPRAAKKGTTRLPAVTTYTKTPNGRQPSQVCQYAYQGYGDNQTGNFLGYGAALVPGMTIATTSTMRRRPIATRRCAARWRELRWLQPSSARSISSIANRTRSEPRASARARLRTPMTVAIPVRLPISRTRS
jgi:hypothetical protein